MIILASASPRRKELLLKITSEFKIYPSDYEENLPSNISATDAAEFLATQKALSVSKKFPKDTIIGADTVIVYDNKIYGKPYDKKEAKEMLSTFSNNTHKVITGVCVIRNKKSVSFTSINEVTFYNLSESEIDDYLNDDEYKDKAGSYAIQGKANLFIKEIKGDYNSIVGLPIAKLNRVLKNFNLC